MTYDLFANKGIKYDIDIEEIFMAETARIEKDVFLQRLRACQSDFAKGIVYLTAQFNERASSISVSFVFSQTVSETMLAFSAGVSDVLDQFRGQELSGPSEAFVSPEVQRGLENLEEGVLGFFAQVSESITDQSLTITRDRRILRFGNLSLEYPVHTGQLRHNYPLRWGDQSASLTHAESLYLGYLMIQHSVGRQSVPRDELVEHVTGKTGEDANVVVRSHTNNIRQKLARLGGFERRESNRILIVGRGAYSAYQITDLETLAEYFPETEDGPRVTGPVHTC